MVQYRDQLMPLVQMDGVAIASEGAQPILVFSDDGRSMGLVVDEIIDIVEERLNIEVGSTHDGILGSAVIKGQATEVIDVGISSPWRSRLVQPQEMRPSASAQSCCWSMIPPSSATWLAPVLKAAGYKVRVANNAQEAWSCCARASNSTPS